jgi:hypothetical protein
VYLLGCIVLASTGLGCSATVAGESDSEATTVERTASDHSEAHARFVRARVGDEGALDLVAGAETLPAVGTCAGPSPSTAGASKPVELLEVGTVTVDANDVRTTLVARRLPDVVSLVSGVVYTARGPEDGSFGSGRYVLHVAGSTDVRAFSHDADAPAMLTSLRVDGQDGPAVVDAAADVTWEPGSADDVVVIDTVVIDTTETGPGATSTRCAFADTGHAHVTGLQGAGVLTLHRVRRVAFGGVSSPSGSPSGIDRGELRFDFSRVVTYRRR